MKKCPAFFWNPKALLLFISRPATSPCFEPDQSNHTTPIPYSRSISIALFLKMTKQFTYIESAQADLSVCRLGKEEDSLLLLHSSLFLPSVIRVVLSMRTRNEASETSFRDWSGGNTSSGPIRPQDTQSDCCWLWLTHISHLVVQYRGLRREDQGVQKQTPWPESASELYRSSLSA
jgi:hypothetical protein